MIHSFSIDYCIDKFNISYYNALEEIFPLLKLMNANFARPFPPLRPQLYSIYIKLC